MSDGGLDSLEKDLLALADPKKSAGAQRYFKTGKGEYGEGDKFLGMATAVWVTVAKKYVSLEFDDLAKLLSSKIHEHRSSALLILKHQFRKADASGKKEIFDFYLAHTKGVNNWDLVDISAPEIVGGYLLDKSRSVLYDLAKSSNIWERRIAIMATFPFLREGDFADTFKIAELLLADKHDLIHKATGWMLREVGKKDRKAEEAFLKKHCKLMPRTMLRYAIEKFDEPTRQFYLAK